MLISANYLYLLLNIAESGPNKLLNKYEEFLLILSYKYNLNKTVLYNGRTLRFITLSINNLGA